MSLVEKRFASGSSAATQLGLVGFAVAAVAVPGLALWGREFGALRNYQYVLAPLFFAAVALAHDSPLGFVRVPTAVRTLLLVSLAWWMLAGEALNFAAMQINGVDYSIFDWMLENTLRGRFMWSPIYDLNHFGVHQMWPMLVLVPIHAVLRFPFALCLVNVALLVCASVFLWDLAHQFIDDDLTASLAVIAFASNPWAGRVLSEGFREESFYPITIFFFVAAWLRGTLLRLGIATLLLCSVKEDASFYVAGFAAAAALRPGRARLRAGLLVVIAAMVSTVDFLIVGPMALKSSGMVEPGIMHLWSAYGSTRRDIVETVLGSPWRVFKAVLTSGWWRLFAPSLFLPLASVECVGAMLPGIVILALVSVPPMRAFVSYHSFPLFCMALCGVLAVGGAHALQPRIVTAVRMALLFFPLFGVGYLRIAWPTSEQRHGLAELRVALANTKAPVCAQTILFPQLGYPEDLRPLNSICQSLPSSVTVVNTQLDPWPDAAESLAREVSVARAAGRSTEFVGGFALLQPSAP
ncbi:MAG: DUF2079 domain-containing protein [Myxococcaceae bacterium]